MGRFGPSLSCFCLKNTRSVTEPTRRVSAKTSGQHSPVELSYSDAAQNEEFTHDIIDSSPSHAACPECNDPLDGFKSNAIKTEQKAPSEAANDPPPTASSERGQTQTAAHLVIDISSGSEGQTQTAAHLIIDISKAQSKGTEGISSSRRQRTSSQETTMAEELKYFSGDDRNTSQGTEHGSGITPEAVALKRDAYDNMYQDLAIEGTRDPTKDEEKNESEGSGVTPKTAAEIMRPRPSMIVPEVLNAGTEQQHPHGNAEVSANSKAEYVIHQSAVLPGERERAASLCKRSKPSSQNVVPDFEQRSVHVAHEVHPNNSSGDSSNTVHPEEEKGTANPVRGESSNSKSNQPAHQHARRDRKKRKSKKTKGKRRHGRTGPR